LAQARFKQVLTQLLKKQKFHLKNSC